MANRSYRVTKMVVIEWIVLEKVQAKEIHDIAFLISEKAEAEGNWRLSRMYYEMSDMVQRSLRISTKQLKSLQNAAKREGETFYIRGLEPWLIGNAVKMLQKHREGQTRAERM